MDHDPHPCTVVREDLLKDSDIRVDTSQHIGTLKGTVTGRAGRAKAGEYRAAHRGCASRGESVDYRAEGQELTALAGSSDSVTRGPNESSAAVGYHREVRPSPERCRAETPERSQHHPTVTPPALSSKPIVFCLPCRLRLAYVSVAESASAASMRWRRPGRGRTR
jgi:hypothetical protein